MNNKIDFVILWVDGSDPEWLKEKLTYQGIENVDTEDIQNSINRYRDMGILKYWFRGVEKFAPWVNNIFFVTYGHLPDFLNINHPKLKIINHKDFIDKKYLPTFNSSAIEMNILNIEGLSEKFVYFNDDMFLTNYVKEEDFFVNDLPCGYAILSPVIPVCSFEHNVINNLILLNESYNTKEVLKKYHKKFFNYKYGLNVMRTFLFSRWNKFCGFKESHLPHAYLKSSFEECYKIYTDYFEETYSHKFRNSSDITQWLVEYWQYINGKFEPIRPKEGKLYHLSENNSQVINDIGKMKYKMICVNDENPNYNFKKVKEELNLAFEKILPEKSSFEI